MTDEDDTQPRWRRSHYNFLDEHFNTILTRMGREDMADRYGNFTSSGDKYAQYRDLWEREGIPYFHAAAMYHLMELFYLDEVRETKNGWVHPYQWVIDNYKAGHNFHQYLHDLN